MTASTACGETEITKLIEELSKIFNKHSNVADMDLVETMAQNHHPHVVQEKPRNATLCSSSNKDAALVWTIWS